MRGLLALDLDGTCITRPDWMPERTRLFLEHAVQQGWGLAFLTGRTFGFARRGVEQVRVPFWMALQQGSLILRMPEREILQSWMLPKRILEELSELARSFGLGVIAYTGIEHQDAAYVLRDELAPEHQQHVDTLRALKGEPWHELQSWQDLPVTRVPLVKLFGESGACQKALEQLQASGLVPATCSAVRIKDPFHPEYDLILITHPEANKGAALRHLRELTGAPHLPVIAAGNDLNDLPLLEEADYAIAMEGSPPGLLVVADQVAGPAEEEGLLPALEIAMQEMKR